MAWVEGDDGRLRCSMCDSPKGSEQQHFRCTCNVETTEELEQLLKEWAEEQGEDEN